MLLVHSFLLKIGLILYTQIKNSITHVTSMIRATQHLKKKTWRKKMNLSCPQDHWESILVLKKVADSANYLQQTLIVPMLSNWAQSSQWFQWFHEKFLEKMRKITKNCKNKPDIWMEKFQTCHSMVFCFENCSDLFWEKKSCDQKNFCKLEVRGREFENSLRSLEQYIQTVKGQNNFW